MTQIEKLNLVREQAEEIERLAFIRERQKIVEPEYNSAMGIVNPRSEKI